MLDYKKILFPVDLSETSAQIIPHVKTIAERFNAEIRMVFVAKVHEYYVQGEEPGAGIKKKVKEYKDAHFSDIPDSNVIVLDGEPGDEILNYINAEGIDVVIMATHGRKALDQAIFGSVASNVARSAPVPVFFINAYMDKFLT